MGVSLLGFNKSSQGEMPEAAFSQKLRCCRSNTQSPIPTSARYLGSSHVSEASGIVVSEVVHGCNVVLLGAHRLRCHLSRVMAASQMVYTPSRNKMVYSVLVEGVSRGATFLASP